MAKTASHPADLATRFKIEALKRLSAEKRKDLEEKERKALAEIEALENKKKQELEMLEKQKNEELKQAEQMLDQAIEESKIDERLWRETDERLRKELTLKAEKDNLEATIGGEQDLRELEKRARESPEYKMLSPSQFGEFDERRREDSERNRRVEELYERQGAGGHDHEPAYQTSEDAIRGPEYDPMRREDIMDAIDPTRAAFKKMGYKR